MERRCIGRRENRHDGVGYGAGGVARPFRRRTPPALLPKEIAGQKIDYIVLDDATDSTQAVKNARKLTSEDHVDAVIGSTVVPNSLAMIDIANETQTPMISMAAAASIVEPMDAKARMGLQDAPE